ncbi:MAG: DUF63 family protein [Candidatus Nanohaloarchaea archaeon]
MGLQEFVWKYLLGPIIADANNAQTAVWNEVVAHTGYNPYNTVAWALLATVFAYSIITVFRRYDIEFDNTTVLYSVPFILLGGFLRFIEDTAATPFFTRPFLITPVLYFVVAGVYVSALFTATALTVERRQREQMFFRIGILVLAPVVVYTGLLVQGLGADGFLLTATLLLTGVLAYLFSVFVSGTVYDQKAYHLAAYSQFFGGVASMISVTQGYTQKQLLAQASTSILGAPGILVAKTAVLAAALYLLKDVEDGPTEAIVVTALAAIGLGTGLRVLLRTITGV